MTSIVSTVLTQHETNLKEISGYLDTSSSVLNAPSLYESRRSILFAYALFEYRIELSHPVRCLSICFLPHSTCSSKEAPSNLIVFVSEIVFNFSVPPTTS